MNNHPTNKEVIHVLRSVAAALLLTGANRFRIIAYQKALDAVEQLTQELYDIWKNDQISEIDGIGPALSQHLDEYFKNPKDSYLVKQMEKLPLSIYELMKAPGIGPKKAYKIVMAFKLEDPKTIFDDVKKTAATNRISQLPGFGEKSQSEIIKAIKTHEKRDGMEERMSLPTAFSLAQDIITYLKENIHVQKVDTLGSLRRMAPTIGDVDLAVVCDEKHSKEVIAHFVEYPQKISIEAQGDLKASIIVSGGRRVDVRVVEESRYGSMLQYFTGSKAHNIKLREHALRKGYSVNEFGIKKVDPTSSRIIRETTLGAGRETDCEFDSESKFYNFLGLQHVPPEIREGTDEVRLASQKKLPNLVQIDDMQGEFHVHSNFNVVPSHDLGIHTFRAMIKKAKSLGYSFLAFSEHNPAMSKLKENEITEIIKKKKERINQLNNQISGFTCFNSLEVDILPNGNLALPEKAFDYLDMAIVSVHSSFRQSRKDTTARILKALSHPKVKILGHPTGRLLSRREGIDADWNKIFEYAKRKNIALEINSWPDRLDLPELLVKKALKNGNIFSINTDAHNSYQMDNIFYGVAVARRGWVTKNDIINCQSVSQVKKWIQSTSS